PVGFCEIRTFAPFVLPRNDAAGVASGWVGDPGAAVSVKLESFSRGDVAHLVVFDRVLMTSGVDAPGVEGEHLGVLVVPDFGIDGVQRAALGAKNLYDF